MVGLKLMSNLIINNRNMQLIVHQQFDIIISLDVIHALENNIRGLSKAIKIYKMQSDAHLSRDN
jgi:hypothetical protein